MNYRNCLSNKTRNTLRKALNEDAANELFSIINGLCEEVDKLRREKLDKKMMFDINDGPTRNNEY
jgi:hypothetical protein